MATIKQTAAGLEVFTPYSPALVSALKGMIPNSQRRWDKDKKCWLVGTQHLDTVKQLCEQYLDETVTVHHGNGVTADTGPAIKVLPVYYIGAPKDRGGETTAYGCDSNGDWLYIFPESVLRSWFDGMTGIQGESAAETTLYGVLCISRTAPGVEVKSAYRKMAKRYHPDVNRDSDAGEMFIKIQRAYDVLSNPQMRKKYDAGLILSAGQPMLQQNTSYWRPPIRCGLVLAECDQELGRYLVRRIMQWEPIMNPAGLELVTSWSRESNMVVETWI